MTAKFVRKSQNKESIIQEIINTDSSEQYTKEFSLMVEAAQKELKKRNSQNLSGILGIKHKEFLSKTGGFSLIRDPKIKSAKTVEISGISGVDILGKIIVRDTTIIEWINPTLENEGIVFTNLKSAFKNYLESVGQVFPQNNSKESTPLSNLVVAHSQLGIVLITPENSLLDGIFVVEIDVSQPDVLIPLRIFASIGKFSKVRILINLRSQSKFLGRSIIVLKSEFLIKDEAKLSVFQNQQLGQNISLFSNEDISAGRNAYVNKFILDTGGILIDRMLSADQPGVGSEIKMTGIYNPKMGQRFFFNTEQNQLASYTSSDLLFKGVIGKQGYAWWKGNIKVSPDTKGANGYQANKNLLLHPTAKVESFPGLEIITDDVHCSHGVTMGNIDKNQMFYLQSRGINEEEAEKLIIEGFQSSAINRISDSELKKIVSGSLVK